MMMSSSSTVEYKNAHQMCERSSQPRNWIKFKTATQLLVLQKINKRCSSLAKNVSQKVLPNMD